MGLFRQPRIRDGIAGEATVVQMSDPRPNDDGGLVSVEFSARIHVRFTLRVRVADHPEYDVKYGCPVKPRKMPHGGAVLPVTSERGNPQKVRIEWDDAPDAVRSPNGVRVRSPIVVERSTLEFELPVGAPAVPSAPSPDPVTTLERLADLHRRGVLTDAEFAAQKARVLGGG